MVCLGRVVADSVVGATVLNRSDDVYRPGAVVRGTETVGHALGRAGSFMPSRTRSADRPADVMRPPRGVTSLAGPTCFFHMEEHVLPLGRRARSVGRRVSPRCGLRVKL